MSRLKNSAGLYLKNGAGLRLASAATPGVSTVFPLTTNGAWCWFTDPRAVYYNGNTYFGYVGDSPTGDIIARRYNHATATVDQSASLYPGFFENDDHDNPAFLVRNTDKRILAFWTEHAVGMYCKISSNPEDVSAWGATANISAQLGAPNHYTYANPTQLIGEAGEPIYLLGRYHVDSDHAWTYFSKSTDGGATWAARTNLVWLTYRKVVRNGTDRIDVAGSFHPVDDATGDPLITDHSVYHFYYQGNKWYTTDDVELPVPFTVADLLKVYDGSGANPRGWIWDIAIESATGYPIVVYATFPTMWTDHRYNYARWNGSAWVNHEICAAGTGLYAGALSYSGGVVLDHSDPRIVYCSRQVAGQWEIYRYTTTDYGATWLNVALTTASANKQIRPVSPLNHPSDLRVLWPAGTYTTYTNFDMGIEAEGLL